MRPKSRLSSQSGTRPPLCLRRVSHHCPRPWISLDLLFVKLDMTHQRYRCESTACMAPPGLLTVAGTERTASWPAHGQRFRVEAGGGEG